ncbi:thioesterase, partial [Bacillus stratosphericus]
TVQIGDINYGGHLSNDAALRLCHECRLRRLVLHGFSELDAGGVGLIMTDAAVEMGAADVGRSGFALLYHISRESDGSSIAKVQTGTACFDYAAQKVCRLPERLGGILRPSEKVF